MRIIKKDKNTSRILIEDVQIKVLALSKVRGVILKEVKNFKISSWILRFPYFSRLVTCTTICCEIHLELVVSTPQNGEKTEKLTLNRLLPLIKSACKTNLLLLIILVIGILLRILYRNC